MAEPFLGEIMLGGFNFAVRNYAFADGEQLPISQFPALFSLLSVQFGGDGRTNFRLPNLASRAPCGTERGPGLTDRIQGETFGVFSVALDYAEMPPHSHGVSGFVGRGGTRTSTPMATAALTNAVGVNIFTTTSTTTNFSPLAISASGGSQPHDNCQPYLGINYNIALYGDFPHFP